MEEVWNRYETNFYPVFLDEENIQTGTEEHHGDGCGITDYECTAVEGEVSKNNAAYRVVLAGMAADLIGQRIGPRLRLGGGE